MAEWNYYIVIFPRWWKAETCGKHLDFWWHKFSEQLLFIYICIHLSVYLFITSASSCPLRADTIISLGITRWFLLLCQCSNLEEQEYSKWKECFITGEKNGQLSSSVKNIIQTGIQKRLLSFCPVEKWVIKRFIQTSKFFQMTSCS